MYIPCVFKSRDVMANGRLKVKAYTTVVIIVCDIHSEMVSDIFDYRDTAHSQIEFK